MEKRGYSKQCWGQTGVCNSKQEWHQAGYLQKHSLESWESLGGVAAAAWISEHWAFMSWAL